GNVIDGTFMYHILRRNRHYHHVARIATWSVQKCLAPVAHEPTWPSRKPAAIASLACVLLSPYAGPAPVCSCPRALGGLAMLPVIAALCAFCASLFHAHWAMQLTMLALHHRLAVEKQTVARPWLRPADGLCWVWFPGCGRGGTTQPLSPPWKILMKHHVQDLVAM